MTSLSIYISVLKLPIGSFVVVPLLKINFKYGTGNDFRNAKYNVNIPGVSIADKGPLQRYSRTSGTVSNELEF